jgi:hypothetical protein
MNKTEKADLNKLGKRRDRSKNRRELKKRKTRLERRAANAKPDTQPGYGKYRGWES